MKEEWTNRQHILKQVVLESLGHIRKWQRKREIRDWHDHIKKVINDKREAFNKLSLTSKEDKTDYSCKRAISKEEVYKNHIVLTGKHFYLT
jgi:predicted SprT family Zn-dependent metalloprotease